MTARLFKMKLLALLAAFFVSVRAAYEGLDLVNPSTATIPGSTVPGKYIVEFSQNGSSKFRKRDGSTVCQHLHLEKKYAN